MSPNCRGKFGAITDGVTGWGLGLREALHSMAGGTEFADRMGFQAAEIAGFRTGGSGFLGGHRVWHSIWNRGRRDGPQHQVGKALREFRKRGQRRVLEAGPRRVRRNGEVERRDHVADGVICARR